MKLEPCSMAALVEARRDGRLGPGESASIARHLATCAECVALGAEFDEIAGLLRAPLIELSALEHRRGRRRLLRSAAFVPEAPPPARRWPVVVAAAAALLAALIGARSLHAHAPAPLGAAAAAASTPAPKGARLEARTQTTLAPEPGARFARTAEAGVERVALESGAVTFSVRPLREGERFLVTTADAEVEVRGTVFQVSAEASRIQAVDVREGKVEVRFRGAASLVLAGERWSRPADPAAAVTMGPAPAVVRAAPLRLKVAPPPADSAAAAERELASGVRRMARGDYGAAAEQLESFATSHADDERAEDAAFLTILALQRVGRRAAAVEAARRYVTRFPRGFRRAQAEAIAAGE